MKLAVIFNGQGAHFQGMALDFVQIFESAKEVINEAASITGYPIIQWLKDDFNKLSETQYAQVAIAATSLAIYRSISPLLPPIDRMGGLSLGEYSALIAANYLPLPIGFQLLKKRGQLMTQECQRIEDSQMLAAIDLPVNIIEEILQKHEIKGQVFVANFNSPTQTVLAGKKDATKVFVNEAKALGYKKLIPLRVEGPFHSPLMAGCQEAFSNFLEPLRFCKGEIPVWSNVTAQVHRMETLKEMLVEHLVKPVQWSTTIENWVQDGISHIIQIGPGQTLAKLLQGQAPQVKVLVVEKIEEVALVANFVRGDI